MSVGGVCFDVEEAVIKAIFLCYLKKDLFICSSRSLINVTDDS